VALELGAEATEERPVTSSQYDTRPGARNSTTPWIVAIALGVATVFGLIFLGTYARENGATADQPAMTATPAPAMKRAAPRPETTTGQRTSPDHPQ
jgi:hypothetical protein